MGKLNDNQKFYTININKVNEILDNNDNKTTLTFKELTALSYILKNIEFDTNIVLIDANDKKYIEDKIGLKKDAYNKFLGKLKKLGIFTKVTKDTYKISDDVLKYGKNEYKEGEYVKVSSNNMATALHKTKTPPSQTDIRVFFYLLKTIKFRNENDDLGNTIVINPAVKEEIFDKYDMCSRSFDNFMKRMKETGLLIKVNNTIFKVNEQLVVFGGDFEEKKAVKQATVIMPGQTPSRMDKFFGKGGDSNEK